MHSSPVHSLPRGTKPPHADSGVSGTKQTNETATGEQNAVDETKGEAQLRTPKTIPDHGKQEEADSGEGLNVADDNYNPFRESKRLSLASSDGNTSTPEIPRRPQKVDDEEMSWLKDGDFVSWLTSYDSKQSQQGASQENGNNLGVKSSGGGSISIGRGGPNHSDDSKTSKEMSGENAGSHGQKPPSPTLNDKVDDEHGKTKKHRHKHHKEKKHKHEHKHHKEEHESDETRELRKKERRKRRAQKEHRRQQIEYQHQNDFREDENDEGKEVR